MEKSARITLCSAGTAAPNCPQQPDGPLRRLPAVSPLRFQRFRPLLLRRVTPVRTPRRPAPPRRLPLLRPHRPFRPRRQLPQHLRLRSFRRYLRLRPLPARLRGLLHPEVCRVAMPRNPAGGWPKESFSPTCGRSPANSAPMPARCANCWRLMPRRRSRTVSATISSMPRITLSSTPKRATTAG